MLSGVCYLYIDNQSDDSYIIRLKKLNKIYLKIKIIVKLIKIPRNRK